MANSAEDPAEAAGCPVDHNARATWLEKAAQAGNEAARPPHPMPPTSSSSPSSPPSAHEVSSLKLDREISTIPRAPSSSSPGAASAAVVGGKPAATAGTGTGTVTGAGAGTGPKAAASNHEQETGASASGNWMYPSERMFFEAMRRKQQAPQAADMAAVVPIHNAVNERAWKEIRAWEARFAWARAANARCGGPRLASFSGDSSRRSPRALLYGLLGYQAPFDRHDWVVERCTQQDTVEYVIDFYQGRDTSAAGGGGRGHGLNFYLDVRPKLNTWEGCKMRFLSLLGW